jgi:hypothetical protein
MELLVAKSWLDRYYAVKAFYVERDSPTTTLFSCGAVLLAAIVAGSRSVQTLTTLTGLPEAFIETTLLVADSEGYFFFVSYGELILAVRQHPEDFDRIENALSELFWDMCEPPGWKWDDALSSLRARYLYGGKQQASTCEEDDYSCLYDAGVRRVDQTIGSFSSSSIRPWRRRPIYRHPEAFGYRCHCGAGSPSLQ